MAGDYDGDALLGCENPVQPVAWMRIRGLYSVEVQRSAQFILNEILMLEAGKKEYLLEYRTVAMDVF